MLREKHESLYHLHVLMYLLNLLIILYIGGLMYISAGLICGSGRARAFLDSVSVLPTISWSSLLLAFGSFGALAAVSAYSRRLGLPETRRRTVCNLLKVILCLVILGALHFGYKEVILLVIIDQLLTFRTQRGRMALLVALALFYILADLGEINTIIPTVSFEQYLFCFTESTAEVLISIRNLLVSVNLICFVIYALMLVQIEGEVAREVSHLNEELEAANAQLLALGAERERMAETRERNRLAREIHDTLGHSLTGILAGVDATVALLDLSTDAARQQLELVSKTARRGLQDVRRSVGALREDAQKATLRDSLLLLVQETQDVSGVRIDIELDTGLNLRTDEDHTVFRIVQESITNAIRHGHAGHIWIAVRWEEAGSLRVFVQDDGQGCKDIKRNFGLRHMRERVELLGGTITYDGSDGFTVDAWLPIRGEETE